MARFGSFLGGLDRTIPRSSCDLGSRFEKMIRVPQFTKKWRWSTDRESPEEKEVAVRSV